jgi:hypothetical protein
MFDVLHSISSRLATKKGTAKNIAFRYGESNPGLAGLMLYMRAADASHYTITDFTVFSLAIALFKFQPAFPSLSARSLPGTSTTYLPSSLSQRRGAFLSTRVSSSTSPKTMATLTTLPCELLLRIFSYLSPSFF